VHDKLFVQGRNVKAIAVVCNHCIRLIHKLMEAFHHEECTIFRNIPLADEAHFLVAFPFIGGA
jgi:hypothetical protein